ncbi:hypothetical protein HYPSUDRAFT_32500 [Hypholoma sublateritium FD-334 SS-4]|uniref:prephenate dehydratase n=1 Tax=Hypholoma sublateritium (strain FD-334 SS-4) TaxID=945553 RepID=A0A0D2PLA6_HYPSF|nr:hypothetical protein HYPSUDRAFT_32500 [Hypholoma sublateritium FD-334 SS-4]
MTTGKMEVAVLGPLGTYTHEAAFKFFGSEVVYNEQDSIADVCGALSSSVPFGIIPQENSIFGTVVETYDILRNTGPNFVRGEIVLKINHCLIVKKGVKLHQIRKVMSHEQALGQCMDFLADKLPEAVSVKTKSTAAAARELLDSPSDCAAICSGICAELFPGLEILFTSIQNERSNFTRFHAIAYSRQASLPHFLTIDYEMKALLRITPCSKSSLECPTDIIAFLLDQNIIIGRIDRRPFVDSVPFSSVYFMEIRASDLHDRSSHRFQAWSQEVESIASKLGTTSRQTHVIGIW